MSTRLRQARLAAVALLLSLVGSGFALAAPAATAADPVLPIHWTVNASTHLKSLNMDVVVPPGTFDGQVNLATGALTGNLSLPPAVQTIKLFGLPIASATFAITQAQPVSGHVDLSDLAHPTATVTSSFTFHITRASASLLPWWNVVGNSCRGSSPVTVSMTGPVSLTGPSTFAATYTIPKFTGCGWVTPILNLIIPGGGNSFSATFAPA